MFSATNHTVERGQVLNESIQEAQRVVRFVAGRQLPRVTDFREIAQDAESVERQALPHCLRIALHVAEHRRKTVLALGIEQNGPELALDGPMPLLHDVPAAARR
jgi:hypothetical protein